ncbi:FKBP-type peptidyl-prolyl cis-trans isomerase [Paraburkholderia sp. GAS448]|uniref:FKBP-type peptidyl-prolyl cis-trans isomerase n=1 Tax=Paraburkholderia sp. GAS448 TaxID=3035136 RepID=UPI003D1E12A8
MLAAATLTSMAFAATPANAGTVEKLPSGVVVEHLTQGTGAQPTADNVVKVNYRGTLADGTEFDSSAKHGGPATFPLGRVIPCWTQGVATMKVGGKAKLTCPAATAYGSRGVGAIPPNSDLTFEVELLDIVK